MVVNIADGWVNTVFVSAIEDIPVVGRVCQVRKDGGVCVEICALVRLVTREDRVQVLLRPKKRKPTTV